MKVNLLSSPLLKERRGFPFNPGKESTFAPGYKRGSGCGAATPLQQDRDARSQLGRCQWTPSLPSVPEAPFSSVT